MSLERALVHHPAVKSHRRAQLNEPNQLALPGLKPCHLPSDIGRHEHLTQCTRVESGHLAKIGVNGEVRENPLEPLTERQRIGGLLDSDGQQAAVLLGVTTPTPTSHSPRSSSSPPLNSHTLALTPNSCHPLGFTAKVGPRTKLLTFGTGW